MKHSSIVSRAHNALLDRLYGIDTRGIFDVAGSVEYEHAATTDYWLLKRTIARLLPQSGDVFCDIGCGLGRPLAIAARLAFAKVIGIEQDPIIAKRAKANVGRHEKISVVQANAEAFDYSGINVLFFFNPFRSPILDMVLDQVERTRNRPMRAVYLNVTPGHREVFRSHGWILTNKDQDVPNLPVGFYKLL